MSSPQHGSKGRRQNPGLRLTWGVLGFVYLAIGTLLWLVLSLVHSDTLVSYTVPGSCFVVALCFFIAHVRLTTPGVRISTRGSRAEKLKSAAAVMAIAAPLLAIPANIAATRLAGPESRSPLTGLECPAPSNSNQSPERGGTQLN